LSSKYSICITHYNNLPTVAESLHRILSSVGPDYEIVVVDNFSTDGSEEILETYARNGRITLFKEKCSRGRGRQIAFARSSGAYTISGIDMDDFISPKLRDLVSLYHEVAEGMLVGAPVTMGPRALIEELGGWNDVNWYEDWDIWRRAARTNKFATLNFDLFDSRSRLNRPDDVLTRVRASYRRSVSGYRVNKEPSDTGGKYGRLMIRGLAWCRSRFGQRFGEGMDPSFNPKDPMYLREWSN